MSPIQLMASYSNGTEILGPSSVISDRVTTTVWVWQPCQVPALTTQASTDAAGLNHQVTTTSRANTMLLYTAQPVPPWQVTGMVGAGRSYSWLVFRDGSYIYTCNLCIELWGKTWTIRVTHPSVEAISDLPPLYISNVPSSCINLIWSCIVQIRSDPSTCTNQIWPFPLHISVRPLYTSVLTPVHISSDPCTSNLTKAYTSPDHHMAINVVWPLLVARSATRAVADIDTTAICCISHYSHPLILSQVPKQAVRGQH